MDVDASGQVKGEANKDEIKFVESWKKENQLEFDNYQKAYSVNIFESKRFGDTIFKEKVSILRRHFVDKVAVSDLCDEYGIHPTMFYKWQQSFFEHGGAAFHGTPGTGAASNPSQADRQA